jgi:ribonuclease HIII
MQQKSPFVTTIPLDQSGKLLNSLKEQGFEIAHPAHTQFQAKKKGVSCTLYDSGKLVVQGKEAQEFIEFFLEPELLKTFTYSYASYAVDKTPRIGVDEAGKGDFFGPLCIAGVYAGEKEIEELLRMGVKDSKKMQDSSIKKLANQIRKSVPYHIVRIGPAKYNELYDKFRNLNRLLAWGHATVIAALVEKTGCRCAHIDQFSHLPLVERELGKKNLDIDFTKKTKGEQDPVIAAASILARDGFVSGLEILSNWLGQELPKGASAAVVAFGRKLAKEKGREIFPEIAKKHFKTLDEILRKSGESGL